jgi:hypothetical protein
MSNVVNLSVQELTGNIVLADRLLVLLAGDPDAKAEIEAQRAVLVEEIKKRNPPPVTVGVNPLKLTARRG